MKFKNVLKVVSDRELLNDNTLVWWLEDDWEVIHDYNFIPLIKILLTSGNNALNMTKNAPLCSFRGGPIMNSGFFKTYFDIHKHYDINCDPEKKVGKLIRCNRIIEEYDSIYIICIFIKS